MTTTINIIKPTQLTRAERRVRLGALVLLIVVLIALGWNVYYRGVVSDVIRSDFPMIRAAGRAVLDGTNIYSVKHPTRGWPFYYPPLMAVLMVPFSALPMPAAVLAWYGVSIAALIWAGYRLVRLCDSLAGRLVGPVTVLAFAVNAGPIVSGLQRGQTASILFAMLVEAFWQYRAQRSARAGAWIAAATALKLYPALVLLPMVLRRDWRGLAGFAVTLLALGAVLPVIVMGPTHGMTALEAFTSQIVLPFFFKTSYADQAVFSEFNQFAPGNQSVFSFLSHWLAPHALPASDSISLAVADLPVSTVRYIAMAISLGLFVLMVLAIRTNPPRTSIREALLWCLPLVAANFISHIAWSHYYAVLAMPYAIAGVIVVTRPADIAWRLVAVTLVFAVLTNWAYMAALACREAGLLLVGSFVLWIGIAVACLLRRPTVTTATSLAMPPT